MIFTMSNSHNYDDNDITIIIIIKNSLDKACFGSAKLLVQDLSLNDRLLQRVGITPRLFQKSTSCCSKVYSKE